MAAHMDTTIADRRAASDRARLDAAGSAVLFCCAVCVSGFLLFLAILLCFKAVFVFGAGIASACRDHVVRLVQRRPLRFKSILPRSM